MLQEHKRLSGWFFRGMNSPVLFQKFFEYFGAWEKLGLKEKPTCEDILEAWNNFQHPKRPEMHEALSRINDMSGESGYDRIALAAKAAKIANMAELNPFQLAMTLWLHNPKQFNLTYELFEIEKTDSLKILVGQRPVPYPTKKPDEEKADRKKFAEGLRKVLRKNNEGYRLKIEDGPQSPDRHVLVVPHEHVVKPDHVFKNDDEIETRDRRPVYEMIIIYYPEEGLLKIKTGGKGIDKAKAIADIFATTMLNIKSASHFNAEEIIHFEKLQEPDFKFTLQPRDEFDRANVVEMSFTQASNPAFSYMLKCTDTMAGQQCVLTQLDKLEFTDRKALQIKAIAIQFHFKGGGRSQRKKVTLRHPYYCDLDETPRDRHVEKALMRWGLMHLKAKNETAVAE